MKLFRYDNPVMIALSRLADFATLSFFVFITSVPIFTVGASLTSAYTCAFKILRDRDNGMISDFFTAFKENFKQATAIWLVVLPVGGLLSFAMYFWANVLEKNGFSTVMSALTLGVFLIYFAASLYVFAMQAIFVNPVKVTLRNAMLMPMAHLGTTFLVMILNFAVGVLCYIFPVIGFLVLIFGTGFMIMLNAGLYLRIFRKYNPALIDEPMEKE